MKPPVFVSLYLLCYEKQFRLHILTHYLKPCLNNAYEVGSRNTATARN
jgi:hypothetical protein